jgi:hypothetical protein
MPTPKRLGERVYLCPLIVTMRDDSDPDMPDVEVEADVIDDELQIRRVTFTAQPGRREVQQGDLSKRVSLGNIRERLIEDFGMRVDSRTASSTLTFKTDGTQEPSRESNRTNYRRTGALNVERVAEVYQSAEHAPTKAVADSFGVAHRTASLYVKQAREAGALPPLPKRGSNDG